MPPMRNNNVIDLDAMLGDDEDGPIHTRPATLFGREWTIVCDVNTFGLAALTTGDPAAIIDFIRSVVHPDQVDDFMAAFRSQKRLSGDRLAKIVSALVEAASERPTKQPSVSSRGASKKTSAPRSTAGSSRQAVRSIR